MGIMHLTRKWTPSVLFSAGEEGAWFDPSDFSTMWQDAGVTPVTAVEQTVGLLLDKSQGLTLGSELVVNGDFSGSDVSQLSFNRATGAIVSGQIVLTRTLTDSQYGMYLTLGTGTLAAGKVYKLVFDYVDQTGASAISLYYTDNSTIITASITGFPKTVTIYLTPTVAQNGVYFRRGGAGSVGETLTLDNISIKELAGNHATQSTAASRPVLRARYNQLTYSEQLNNAAWSVFSGGTNAISANQTTAPDGASTADLMTAKAATNVAGVYNAVAVTTPTGVNHTFIVAVKKNTHRYVGLHFQNSAVAENFITAVFDLDGGGSSATETDVGTTSGTIVSTSQTSLGDGWYRLSITGRMTATTAFAVISMVGAATGNTYNASGLNSRAWAGTESIYIWGADLRVSNDGVGLPAYQRIAAATDYDTVGFPPYLLFDGSDDSLATAAIDFSATDNVSIFSGVRKLGQAVRAYVVDFNNPQASTNAFAISCPETAAAADVSMRSRGSGFNSYATYSSFGAPVTAVLTGMADISADSTVLRVNGVEQAVGATDQGSGNYSASGVLTIGRGPLSGRLYQLIVRGALTSGDSLTSAETFVNGKTGAY